jgi:antagonist of KipI
VLDPGLYTLVVDFGRPGARSLGVPVGGAADRSSLALGNALVGNPPDVAALEVSLAGPVLRADRPLACVLYGAPFAPATDRRALTAGTTFTLLPGETLRVGGTPFGMRAYFCVRGGLQVPPVLGSRSSLGPLRAGAALPCLSGAIHGRFVRLDERPWEVPRGGRTLLRVVDGPQAGWFHAEDLYGGPGGARSFQVTPASNRMGLRLRGEALRRPGRELVSEPVCPGAVQVTSDGQCIVLGVDGQTIGGYPKAAQVISADLDRLGQLRPGDLVGFERVEMSEAEGLYRRQQAVLREWVTRLREAEVFEVPGAGPAAPAPGGEGPPRGRPGLV